MHKYHLDAQVRKQIGRKVKELRKQDLIPATVYGKQISSASISVAKKEFQKIYADAGETGLIELKLNEQVRPVLIHRIQIHPVNEEILHIEFHQVDLKEKVKTKVKVEFSGESPVVAQKEGVLLTVLDEIEVEALPTDLPEKLSMDISVLTKVDQELKVADLGIPKEVTVLSDPGLTLAKIGSLVTKEAEKEAAEAAAAAAAAATEAAPAQAEATPTSPGGEETKKEEAKPAPEAANQPSKT